MDIGIHGLPTTPWDKVEGPNKASKSYTIRQQLINHLTVSWLGILCSWPAYISDMASTVFGHDGGKCASRLPTLTLSDIEISKQFM